MKAAAELGVAIVLLFTSCAKSPQQQANNPVVATGSNVAIGVPPKTPMNPNPESPITGAEVWKVSGTNYSIQGTSLLSLGNGQTMFTVKVLCEFLPGTNDKPIARSIAKYAVDQGYTAKVKESWWNGVPQQFSGAVGVALMQKPAGDSLLPAAGYRYNFKISELGEGKE